MRSKDKQLLSDDLVLSEKILHYLSQFPETDLKDASLLVNDGKVYLSGRVSSKKLKKRILSGIKKNFGISVLMDDLFIFKHRQSIGHQRSVFKDLGI